LNINGVARIIGGNGRAYKMKQTVELRLYPPWQTLMQAKLTENPLLPLYFIYVVNGR